MKSLIKFTLFSLSTAFLISCSNSKPSTGGSSTGGTGGTGTGSSVSVPFLVEVRASYENNSSKTLFGSCSVSTSDPIGTTKRCTIQFPELLLFNSRLEFYVATNNKNTCRKVLFFPYQYIKSTSATFAKDGETSTVDCSALADPYCFGGAAPGMVDPEFNFPGTRGLYFLTANQLSQKYTFESTDIRGDSDKDRTMGTNTVMANTLPVASRGSAINNGFVRYMGSGEYLDYTFTCMDEWANVNYEFEIVISDDDSEDLAVDPPFPLDYFWDWGF